MLFTAAVIFKSWFNQYKNTISNKKISDKTSNNRLLSYYINNIVIKLYFKKTFLDFIVASLADFSSGLY